MTDITQQDHNALLPDLSAEIYYASDRLGSSRLKAFSESPLAYKNFESKGDTSSMKFGRAYHAYLEGEQAFDDGFFLLPDGVTMAHKEGKELKRLNPTKQHISYKDFEKLVAMSTTLQEHPEASRLLSLQYLPEVSILWTHKEPIHNEFFKIKCKGRIDRLAIDDDGNQIMIDFKTCASADESAVMRAIHNYSYWLQEAHYRAGYRACLNKDTKMIFIFQETQSPYDVCVVELEPDARIEAHKRYEQTMSDLACACIENNFPGKNPHPLRWRFLDYQID